MSVKSVNLESMNFPQNLSPDFGEEQQLIVVQTIGTIQILKPSQTEPIKPSSKSPSRTRVSRGIRYT